MAFQRPTFGQLLERAMTDIAAGLPGTDPRARRNLLNIIARAHAGSVHGLYGYLDWLAKQLMEDTCEAEFLDRRAAIWKVTRKAAVPAKGSIAVTGTDGTTVPAGTVVQRSDAAEYATDADGTIASGTAAIAVTAVAAGTSGNTAANSALTFVSPIAGVNSAATVAAGGLAGGADIETDDSLRTRLLARIQTPPHGGAKADYIAWAIAVADVTRAWVYPQALGAGTVLVRIMTDDATADGIPTAAKVTDVQTYVDDRRPVAAAVTVAAPSAVLLNFTIAVTPNTQAVRDAVTAELRDMLRRDAEPGATIYISRIREAISVAAGEARHVLTAPAADVTHLAAEIATMGTITWV